MKDKALYTWNWVGGGYNQCYAHSKVEALERAEDIWSAGKVDLKTLKRNTATEAETYWKNFPVFD